MAAHKNKKRRFEPESKTAKGMSWEYGGLWWLCKKLFLLLAAGAALTAMIMTVIGIRDTSNLLFSILIIVAGIILTAIPLNFVSKYRVSVLKAVMPLLLSCLYLLLVLMFLQII